MKSTSYEKISNRKQSNIVCQSQFQLKKGVPIGKNRNTSIRKKKLGDTSEGFDFMFRPTLRPRKNYSTKSTEEKSFDRFRPGSISQTHIQTLATNFRHVQTFATEYTHVQTFATDFKPVHTFATEFRHTFAPKTLHFQIFATTMIPCDFCDLNGDDATGYRDPYLVCPCFCDQGLAFSELRSQKTQPRTLRPRQSK